jgi:hypothetical protein
MPKIVAEAKMSNNHDERVEVLKALSSPSTHSHPRAQGMFFFFEIAKWNTSHSFHPVCMS